MLNPRLFLSVAAAAACFSGTVRASSLYYECAIPEKTVLEIQKQLDVVVALPDANGGIFKPNRMWSAIVDRSGKLCSVTSVGDAWPGSRAIAIAKAGTANDFSNSALSLSTANLYGPTQPGGSLYGLKQFESFQS